MTELETLQDKLAELQEDGDSLDLDHRHAVQRYDVASGRLYVEIMRTEVKIKRLTASDNPVNV
jgi:hypothetical protein